jgi:hypothetical protein
MTRNPAAHRDRPPLKLVFAGLAAQIVGVATQGLWHGLLAGRHVGLLTEERTFLIDHTISNAGVVCMIAGSVLWHQRQPGTAAARLVLGGTVFETIGALLDAYSHLRGGESPIAFGLIGAGFILAVSGVVTAWRAGPHRTNLDCRR